MYRGFVKNIDNLAGRAISSSDMRITNISLKRDVLVKATSDFTLVAMPKAIKEGDVFGVYDEFGKVVYLGIIKSLDENVVQCDQMYGLFDDDWKWNNPIADTIEGKIKAILENDYAGSSDGLEAQIYSAFSFITTSATENDFQTQDNTYVVNMMKFLFDLYESYGIMLDFDIGFNAVTPVIKIGKPNYPVIKLGNNNQVLRNFNIIKETQEINKLVIYDSKGEVVRATYFATPSGITTNAEALDRLTDINTKIVCSDDEIEDIVASNLSEEMYNHKITVQLVLANRLYNFDDFHLGQQFDIYYDGELYNSILTGYSINIDNQGEASVVDLTFGKVRYSLENTIYKMQKNSASVVASASKTGGFTEITGTNIFGRQWDNGFLEYWIVKPIPAGSYTSWQSHYYRNVNANITFPVPFTTALGTLANYDNPTAFATQAYPTQKTSTQSVRLMAFTNQSSLTGDLYMYIWGYWK